MLRRGYCYSRHQLVDSYPYLDWYDQLVGYSYSYSFLDWCEQLVGYSYPYLDWCDQLGCPVGYGRSEQL